MNNALRWHLRYDSGQVAGLASASAVFQSRLDTELHRRFPSQEEEVQLSPYFKNLQVPKN